MKLPAYQLSEHLKKNLLPIYIISGEEPLLVQEARDAIRQTAEKLGFQERQYFETTKDFDWQLLADVVKNLSLFSNKCLLELKLVSKPGTQGGKALVNYAENLPNDKILIITADKLDQASQKTIWFQTLCKNGVFIPIWPLDFPQLIRWIQQRLQQAGISTNHEGIRLIAELTEGNLLATAQEIMKLQLLYPKSNISVESIREALSNQARYDIFMLVDSALEGDGKKALKILMSLKQESTEPILILWSIARELRQLSHLQQGINTGNSLENSFKKLQIWEKRQHLFKKALQTHKLIDVHRLLIHASKIDGIIKGIYPGNVWNEISQLLLSLSGFDLRRATILC